MLFGHAWTLTRRQTNVAPDYEKSPRHQNLKAESSKAALSVGPCIMPEKASNSNAGAAAAATAVARTIPRAACRRVLRGGLKTKRGKLRRIRRLLAGAGYVIRWTMFPPHSCPRHTSRFLQSIEPAGESKFEGSREESS